MATCQESIQSTSTFDVLDNSRTFNFNINPTTNKLYYLELDTTQTVYFNVSIVSSSIPITDIFFTVFRVDTLAVVRNSRITASTVVATDMQDGKYYICFRVYNGSFNLNLKVNYLRYSRNTQIPSDNYYGEVCSFDIKTSRKPVACNQVLLYSLETGRLPTGLTINSAGYISGTLPLIDEDGMKDIPSSNLYQETNGTYSPIGVNYEFSLRVRLASDPKKYDIRKFCISVVNDWSLTQTLFDDVKYTDKTGQVYVHDNNLPDVLCNPCADEIVGEPITYKVETDIITKNAELDYAVDQYNKDAESDVFIDTQHLLIDTSESIVIPNDVTDIMQYVKDNFDALVEDGYIADTLSKYISREYTSNVEIIDGVQILNIESGMIDYNDPLYVYNASNQSALVKEPIYGLLHYGESVEVNITWTPGI